MEFLAQIDPVALAALTFAVVGVVELVKRVLDRDYRAAIIIAVAAVAGAILAGFAGVSWFNGLLVGFNASGFITAITRVGTK